MIDTYTFTSLTPSKQHYLNEITDEMKKYVTFNDPSTQLVFKGNILIGFINILPVGNITNDYEIRIAIKEEHRHQGIAQKILTKIIDTLFKNNVTNARMYISKDNKESTSMALALGFVIDKIEQQELIENNDLKTISFVKKNPLIIESKDKTIN